MNFRIVAVSSMLIALQITVACAPVKPVESVPDPRLDHLVAGMDKCLVNQSETTAQLQNQTQKLDEQLEQLDSMSRQMAETAAASKVKARPTAIACPKSTTSSNKQVVGQLEQVWLPDLELSLTAKIDTGVETASLDARNIEMFERDGKSWVRFEIVNPKTGEPVPLERRLKRTVGTVKSGTSESQRRPVVKLGILMGRTDQTAEFILFDRSHKTYQLLIGRNILKDVMVVDVSRKNAAPYALPDEQSRDAGAAR